jgi:hypothetical protein
MRCFAQHQQQKQQQRQSINQLTSTKAPRGCRQPPLGHDDGGMIASLTRKLNLGGIVLDTRADAGV